MTQNEQILSFLHDNGSITQLEAMNEFGCTRLSGRIYDLRHMGHKITRVMETGLNRFGAKTCYARYFLAQ